MSASALSCPCVTKVDPEERRQIRVRARKFLIDAQALGDKGNLVRVLLDEIPDDALWRRSPAARM